MKKKKKYPSRFWDWQSQLRNALLDPVHALNLWDNAYAYLLLWNYIPLFCGTADNCFYFAITPNLSNRFSFQHFHHNFMLRIVCITSPSTRSHFHRDLKCTPWQFSLSVFKCCLALLILSGKLECKSGESSFILMSQVLDLLKRQYWNGLELATFKEPCIHSCLWCRSGFGKLVFPRRLHASLAFHHFGVFLLRSLVFLQSHFRVTLPDRSFMLMQAVWRRLQRGEKGAMTRGRDSSNRHLVLVACRTELLASFEV